MKHLSILRGKCKKFQLVNRKEGESLEKTLIGRITEELSGLDLSLSV
jgi:hypothetical protein